MALPRAAEQELGGLWISDSRDRSAAELRGRGEEVAAVGAGAVTPGGGGAEERL